jgi:peroxiredoxin family protein
MKGRKLAETLFNSRSLPKEAADQAVRDFLQEAAKEEGLKAYACLVLRKLIDDAGKVPTL